MAFVNAFLTEEEKAEFEAKAIPNPGNKFHNLRPYVWTIDRKEDVFLVWGLQEREEPHDYYFLLGWKGTPINVKLSKYWVSGAELGWELIRLELPAHLKDQRDEIIKCLKDALRVYGYDGDPNDQYNQAAKVHFKF